MFGLGYIINVAWVALSGVLAIPVFILAILHNKCGDNIIDNGDKTCFKPSDYAITSETYEICGQQLKTFCIRVSQQVSGYTLV